ncbi:urea ABC transporter ATP-binding subunit UrtE [Paenibacillus hamazuiensis]|uniref:urea ABC transporter ATP-binding subunit UrtE n=1 Tax=Paenibacillus hamazuiensis TaxID=2936508 RepID=UPI00200BCD5D|nr:urea ABC transporter ATP-binding subunit UrtE [Paenibacillus hamazuiensis]
MLSIDRLEVGYGESAVLRDVSLEVRAGQVVCLMGRNGVGKTTLMRGIMGLLRARSGSVRFAGRDLTGASPEKRARSGIGYVPQGRDIFPQLTVEENLLLGLEAAAGRGSKLPEAALALFPALRDMLQRKGGDLSGGQQQQLAIARALAAGPKLLLLDEPMEGIQPSVVMEIERVIETLKASREMAILLVEQSLTFATRIADYYCVLDKGAVVAEGSPANLTEEQVKRHLVV